MKCDKRTQNIESSVRMTVQKNIKKHVNTNILANKNDQYSNRLNKVIWSADNKRLFVDTGTKIW